MARFWASSSGNVGVTTRLAGCFFAFLYVSLMVLGFLGIAALIYALV